MPQRRVSAIGVLVSLLFSVVPLLRVRAVKPSLLLRDESAASAGIDWTRIAALMLVSAGLVAVTAWQAASLKVGLIVCAGFSVLAIVLMLAGRLLVRAVSPLASTPSFPLRHAVLHLSRPGNQTRVILLAVGLGAFFIVGVRGLQSSLLQEFSTEMTADAPDMFLMDVQREQVDGVRAFLSEPSRSVGAFRLIPVLRARITGVAGRDTQLESFEDVRARGSLAREYTVTYRDRLEANEEISAGRFWQGPQPTRKYRSRRAFTTASRSTSATRCGSTSSAARSRPGSPASGRSTGRTRAMAASCSSSAPVSSTTRRRCSSRLSKGLTAPTPERRFQHDLVARFPNVSVIDFHEILATIQDVMSKVTLAISVVGGLVLFSGALILIGAVAMTKFQRVYEAAVFKTLGANTRTIARMLLFEYGVLGLLAGSVGSLGAVALTWGVSRYALDIPWRLFWIEHVGGVVATAVLVAAIGVLSSLDVLRNKPLLTLRAE